MNGLRFDTSSASARCAVSSAPLAVTTSMFGLRPTAGYVPELRLREFVQLHVLDDRVRDLRRRTRRLVLRRLRTRLPAADLVVRD